MQEITKSKALESALDGVEIASGAIMPPAPDSAGDESETLDGLASSYMYALRNQVGVIIFDGADIHTLQRRPWNEQAIRAALDYNPRQRPNCLVFYGPPGYGKTTLAVLAAKSAIARLKRCHVHFERAGAMLRRLRALFPSEQDYAIKTLCSRDVLIVDDLGVSAAEKAAVEELLLEIIDWRYARGKALIVTTNVHANDWDEHFGGRIASRLRDKRWCRLFHVAPQTKG